jgi:hypothetical protein
VRTPRRTSLLAALLSLPCLARASERLPVVYWEQPADTAETLRRAQVGQIRVPPERATEWQQAGFDASALAAQERSLRVVLEPPGIAARAEWASATRRPWIDANGWRFLRRPDARYFEPAAPGKGALAAAEAFGYGADVVLAVDPGEIESVGRTLVQLRALPELTLPAVADLAVVDDGSSAAGELMNLLARRNLLFRPVARATKHGLRSVELGSKQYPRSEAANPDALALKIRTQLGDERRALRVYGSEVVLARLTGDAERLRLQLVNYGGREIEGLRVRLRGAWTPGEAFVLEHGRLAVEALLQEADATEFSLPVLGTYALVDLTRSR